MMRSFRRLSLVRLSIIAIACCVLSTPSSAQARPDAKPRDVIYGTITDSLTGAPLVGARVEVLCSRCDDRVETDSMGRYAYGRIPNGTWNIEYYCPSLTRLGRFMTKRRASVGVEAAEVNILVPRGVCIEPPYFEEVGVFRGRWSRGFEEDSFRPCDGDTTTTRTARLVNPRPSGAGGRVTLSPVAEAQFERWPWRIRRQGGVGQTYFVVWRGTFRGPGQYGPSNVHAYEMQVDSIIDLRNTSDRPPPDTYEATMRRDCSK